MSHTLFDGIVAHDVTTPRLTARVLERAAAGEASATVVLIHGNVSSSLFFQPTMLALPAEYRALAIDPDHGMSQIVATLCSAAVLPDWAFAR